MTPDVVVDIGNTRMKWGRCYPDGIPGLVSLAPESPENWDLQAAAWNLPRPAAWAVASVHPDRLKQFTRWATARGDRVQVIEHAHIPLTVDVEEPAKVGIDRLLSSLAAHRLAERQAAIVFTVGTAVTADLVDENATFRGGAIFPGPRLMAESLHAWTAQLPLVDAPVIPPDHPPGRNTHDAICAGIRYAIVGAAYLLLDRYAAICSQPWVFLTGGALGDLADMRGMAFGDDFMGSRPVPTLTLEGIRIAAEGMP
jgi:type III pantothenate kinase